MYFHLLRFSVKGGFWSLCWFLWCCPSLCSRVRPESLGLCPFSATGRLLMSDHPRDLFCRPATYYWNDEAALCAPCVSTQLCPQSFSWTGLPALFRASSPLASRSDLRSGAHQIAGLLPKGRACPGWSLDAQLPGASHYSPCEGCRWRFPQVLLPHALPLLFGTGLLACQCYVTNLRISIKLPFIRQLSSF